MSFFGESLKTVLTTRWRSWLLLLLVPLLILGVRRFLPTEETGAPVQVGVSLPRQGGEEFWNRLETRSGMAVSFLQADTEKARRQVAMGQWDCALLLPEDFDERLERRDTYQLITLLTGPGSTVYPMVRETAAACVIELVSPSVAEDYLLDSGVADENSIAVLRPRLHETLMDQERVLVTMETANGQPLDALTLADSGMDNLLSGLLAIVLLVYALFTAIDLGRWMDTPFARRMLPLKGALTLLAPRLAGAMLPALCAGTLGLLAAGSSWRRLPSLTVYVLFLGAMALAFVWCKTLLLALPVLMPFVPAAGLLFSSTLMDVSLLFPVLAPVVRWTPITLYLRACEGSWGDGLALAAAAAAILALLRAVDRTNRTNF